MTLDQAFEQLKALPRRQLALGAFVIIALASTAYVYLQRIDVQDELVQLEQRRDLAQSDVQALSAERSKKAEELTEERDELAALEDEVAAEREIEVDAPSLSSEEDALNLRSQFLSYAAERNLDLVTFVTNRGTETLGDQEVPAISYSLVIEASPGSLIGILDLVGGVGSARIDRLEIQAQPGSGLHWNWRSSTAQIRRHGSCLSCRATSIEPAQDPTPRGHGEMSIIPIFAIGAAVGSFLNVVADRIPAGGSVVSPRSHCPSCNRPLSNADLVPVVSYLWLRGRCRTCGVRIPFRLFAIEVAMGLLFVAVLLKFGLTAEFVVMAAGASLLVVIAIIDFEHGLILNRILLPSMIVLLVLSPFWSDIGQTREFIGASGMVASLANSVAAGAGAFLVFSGIAFAFPSGMGGGDVKMAGVLGLLVGFPGILVAIYTAVLIGGTLAIALLLLRKRARKDSIPFGPFLSLGGLIALLANDEAISGYEWIIDRITGA